jgi:hypothetical protein
MEVGGMILVKDDPRFSPEWPARYADGTIVGMEVSRMTDQVKAPELVDLVTQLAMMLQWDEDYTIEFKVKCITEAIRYLTGIYIRNV